MISDASFSKTLTGQVKTALLLQVDIYCSTVWLYYFTKTINYFYFVYNLPEQILIFSRTTGVRIIPKNRTKTKISQNENSFEKTSVEKTKISHFFKIPS